MKKKLICRLLAVSACLLALVLLASCSGLSDLLAGLESLGASLSDAAEATTAEVTTDKWEPIGKSRRGGRLPVGEAHPLSPPGRKETQREDGLRSEPVIRQTPGRSL